MQPGYPHARRRKLFLGLLATLLALAGAAVLFACSQTPTSVPVRTFERAQRMDVACLRLYDPPRPGEPANLFRPREPLGLAQQECAPVPADLDGESFDKQLFALVTQSTRGELAVVDLSAGKLVDQSRATPGINFLPVGALPTDVATTPDGTMAFVASAETNKPAIYGIPTRRILGDTPGFPRDPEPITLASWPVCALPQTPGLITVVPRRPGAGAQADAGAAEAGTEAGADGGAPSDQLAPAYDLVVVLPGDRSNTGKIVTLDVRPFRRGGLKRTPSGEPDYATDPTLSPGPVLAPGVLESCDRYVISAVELTGSEAVPTRFVPGAAWDDGVKYVEGGVDLTCNRPQPSGTCARPCCDVPAIEAVDASGGVEVLDAGAEGGPDSGSCEPLGLKEAGVLPLAAGPLDPPRLVSMARSDQILYVADDGVPLIHVLDMSNPAQPRELPPLLATSTTDPAAVVKVKDLAVSPPTRDYKRFLYAVDRTEGSILVYDITDPLAPVRTPLSRPHPEVNPFQPPDRIAFSSPVVAVTFARHDVPLAQIDGVRVPSAASGLLCNPNPNLDESPQADLGFYYRAGSSDPGQAIGPRRLRGIFAFATLASGQVVTIDVDDWDAPCRRPLDMTRAASDLAPAQPVALSGDLDAYHAPTPAALSVTEEGFFPLSAPHTLRSEVLIKDDPTTGNQLPRVQSNPVVSLNGIVLSQVGPGSENTPALDLRFSREDAHAHIDQDWQVVYEGPIPGFEGLTAAVSTQDDYASLVLSQPQGKFCSRGVEDWARGVERTTAINTELARFGKAPAARSERLMSDYVQLTEKLLPADDDYWTLGQACWEGSLASASGDVRHEACERTFGTAEEQNPQRDFPIVEAYDSRLALGRFYTPPTGQREVVYKDASNASTLKLMQCCFHHQVRFQVRTGNVWRVVGQALGGGAGVGFFSHLTTDSAGRCVSSCDAREALLNGRLPTIPQDLPLTSNQVINKNSPLAVRNPMFSMVLFGGQNGAPPARDTVYNFSTRGQFRALAVAFGGASTQVSPQSMRFIDALGQIAVVDGASQGLVLIDLRGVTVARAPYF